MPNESRNTKDLGLISHRIIQHVTKTWLLSDHERDLLVGDGSGATWSKLQSAIDAGEKPDLDAGTLRRASYVLRINRILEQLFDTQECLAEFVHSPNSQFGSRTPLGLMLGEGEAGLETVHDHLFKHFNGINP